MRFGYLLLLFLLWFPIRVFAQNKHSKIYIHKLSMEGILNSGLENRFRNGIINSILRNFEGKYTIVDDDSLSILLKQVETLQKMDCSDEICMKQIADAIDANEVISGTISSQNGLVYVSLRNQIRDSKNLNYSIKSTFQMEFPEFLLDYYAGESGKKLLDLQYNFDPHKVPTSTNGNLSVTFLKIKPVPGTNLNSMEFKTSDKILAGVLEEIKEELDKAAQHSRSKEYAESTEIYNRILNAFNERLSSESLKKLEPFVREIQTSITNNYNLEYKEKINNLDRNLFDSNPEDLEKRLSDYHSLLKEYSSQVPEKYRQLQILQSIQERKEKVELALFSLMEKEADKAYSQFDFSLSSKLYSNILKELTEKTDGAYKSFRETIEKKAETSEKTGRSHLSNRLETTYLIIEREFTAEALADTEDEKESHQNKIHETFREGILTLAKSEFTSLTQIDRIKKEIKRVNQKLKVPISFQVQLNSLLHEGLETKNPTQIVNSHLLGADWESKTGLFWGSAKSKLKEILESTVQVGNSNRELKKLFTIHFENETIQLKDSKKEISNIQKFNSDKKKIKKSLSQKEIFWESSSGSYNWYQANQICNSRDLRLPTIEELEDSYESGETESWIENNSDKRYWSSTISVGENGAYNLDVFKGEIRWDHLSNYAGVRCLK
ncbi:cag pathogenicity island protein CagA [Leptospira noguchii]|uniref:cag pathogenicity island protein CagA n=1 Tax=Leptospira noguchii TaxID=28182 RepID=UPI001F06272C|nr:cag pathogenicity island protein CagA [Leptospira noguchii]MCH1912065.1 cag pathogenicity island protein CagA [Leptospira noguchii]MCH1915725.1 cag pathogenicity island protein CagA [Leptospira noguchii]UOG63182.1 cag pathogenicity island protein CagA [Leptospira noguchii]